MHPSTSRKHFDGIDVLRGISIIAVVLHHSNIRMLIEDIPVKHIFPDRLENILFWNGANGVTVFFAISGFLITTTALRRWPALDTLNIKSFYRLRFARIVPLLLALLTVLSVLHLLGVSDYVIRPERASLPRALLAALTFHINWLESVSGYLPGSWDVLWSLSVEEVFYLFFPLLCRFIKIRSLLIAIFLLVAGIGPFARTILTHNSYWADCGYLSCMDSIALGCLTAILAHSVRLSSTLISRLSGAALMFLVVAAKSLAGSLGLYKTGLDATVLALGTCLVMLAVAQTNAPGSKFTAPIRWYGRHSYEIYLTHVFLVFSFTRVFIALKLSLSWVLPIYFITLVLAGLLGAFVARFYSEPLNKKLRENLPAVLRPEMLPQK